MTAKCGRGLGTPDGKRKAWKVLSDVMDRCVCRGRLLGQLWGGKKACLAGKSHGCGLTQFSHNAQFLGPRRKDFFSLSSVCFSVKWGAESNTCFRMVP